MSKYWIIIWKNLQEFEPVQIIWRIWGDWSDPADSITSFLQNVFLIIVVVPIIFAATTAAKITLDASAGDLSSYSDRAVVMSRYANWTDLGAASGPIAGYALLNLLNIEWTYLFSSILLGLGLLFYFWVHKSKNNFL